MKLLKFHAYYQSHKRTIQTASGAFAFFLILGFWMLFWLFIAWHPKGAVHAGGISKADMSLLLFKVFNIVNAALILIIALSTALNKVIAIATSKLFGYFNIENPIQQAGTSFSAVQAIVAILISSHAAYLVLVAFIYKY